MNPTIDIYQWLVQYQCNINLPEWIKHAKIEDGSLVPKTGRRARKGFESNNEVKGFLVMANGDTLVDRLHEDRIIIDEKAPLWVDIENRVSFLIHLRSQESDDGAYVVNTKARKMARIIEFSNDNKYLRDNKVDFGKSVPQDFLCEDGSVNPSKEMGLKSRNAIRTAGAYEGVESYQLKATPYNNSGLGTVCHFTKDGLKNMFFIRLRKDPGSYVDSDSGERYEKYRLIGVYRNYRKNDNGITLSKEQEVIITSPESDNAICIYVNKKGNIRRDCKGILPFVEKSDNYRVSAPLEVMAK